MENTTQDPPAAAMAMAISLPKNASVPFPTSIQHAPQLTDSPSCFPPIRACLFDLDGTLLDSEEYYTLCANAILAKHSKPPLPWSILSQMQAGPHAHHHFHSWASPMPITPAEWDAELSEALKQHLPFSQPLQGVEILLKQLGKATSKSTNNGDVGGEKIHLALATSSHGDTFLLKTGHLKGIFDVFEPERRVLGDDERLKAGRGKPCPDIYLLALRAINQSLPEGVRKVKKEECLVFEDSVPGLEAGRRAGMSCVWVPHPSLAALYAGREKEILAGKMGLVKAEGLGEHTAEGDDGWAEMLVNLVDFPFERYGIVVEDEAKEAAIKDVKG